MKFGLCTILFLIFLTLKLAGVGVVAAWSWVWVFAPLWIPLAIVTSVWLIVGISWLIISGFTGTKGRFR